NVWAFTSAPVLLPSDCAIVTPSQLISRRPPLCGDATFPLFTPPIAAWKEAMVDATFASVPLNTVPTGRAGVRVLLEQPWSAVAARARAAAPASLRLLESPNLILTIIRNINTSSLIRDDLGP